MFVQLVKTTFRTTLRWSDCFNFKHVSYTHLGLARTFLAEQGVQHEHAEACLAHKTGSQVSLAYNHANYLEKRRDIMQMWGDYIEKCSAS